MSTLTDEPLPRGGADNLGLHDHTWALIEFIKATNTPMTIGIQGEWGSGKTSLMNQIVAGLQVDHDGVRRDQRFKQIWVNAWESSLMSSHEETLIKIIKDITNDLLHADEVVGSKSKLWAKLQLAGVGVKQAAKVALRDAGEIADLAQRALGIEAQSIKTLRLELQEVIDGICNASSNPYSGIIIYVDDLDRMKPGDAVSLLELLKNVFNLKKCVFVLAIDYNVVVKGLSEKFGSREDTDWEFRAFFDKLIQLPFQMPMASYDITTYVKDLFSNIKMVGNEPYDEEFFENASEVISRTVGVNPRSIKRLVNSLSLISLANSIRSAEVDQRSVLFTLATVSLQIAHPRIYRFLAKNPRYLDWDLDYAAQHTQRKEEQIDGWLEDFNEAKKRKAFDEPWEQCLYRLCYEDKRDRAKSEGISQVFNLLKDYVEEDGDVVMAFMAGAIGDSSVTSVEATDILTLPQKGSGKWRKAEGFESWINDRITSDFKDRFPNFPSVSTLNALKTLHDVSIGRFRASEEDGASSNYSIHYTGALTLKFKKKKVLSVWPSPTKQGDRLNIQVLRSPKIENKFLHIQGVERTFSLGRKPFRILNIDTRETEGTVYQSEFQNCAFYPESDDLNWAALFAWLVGFSSDALEDDNMIRKRLEQLVSDFHSEANTSERFLAAKAAIDLLFDVNRRQVVDLESLGVKQ